MHVEQGTNVIMERFITLCVSANHLLSIKCLQCFSGHRGIFNILFLNYFKGFELLRRYLAEHNPGVNLNGLDFEAIDKEIIAEEAAGAGAGAGAAVVAGAGAAVTTDDIPRVDEDNVVVRDRIPSARCVLPLLDVYIFLGCPVCFGALF